MPKSIPSTPARAWSRIVDAFTPIGKKRRSGRYIHAVLSTNQAGHVSIAIQNEDMDEDLIVVTTINEIPFCCHADLLTMNRVQLLAAAQALNTKLPVALRIDLTRTDALIRNSIELVVGLRQNVPNAPVKPVQDPSTRPRYSPTSPMSPLARRTQFQANSTAIPQTGGLAILKEEVEGEEPKVTHVRKGDEESLACRKRRRLAEDEPATIGSSRITRSQSARVPAAAPCSTILRSQSQRPLLSRNPAFFPGKNFMTSTPKRQRSIAAISMDEDDLSITVMHSSPTASAARRIKRRRRSSGDDMEMTFGLEGMSMLAKNSGFDISIN